MTADFSVSIDDRAVQRMLARAPGQVRGALHAGLLDSALYIKRIFTTYPPQRPGSTYKRTRTLGRSWFHEIHGAEAAHVYSAGNIAPYNRVVMDRDQQARVHRGRWVPAQTVVERSRAQMTQFLVRRLQAALGG